MANERRNQLEKFNGKWFKKEQDLEVIKQAEAKKQQQSQDDHGGLEKVEEFKQETGLKEIVAGFTTEGMKVFAQMFSNSIKSAMAEESKDMSNILKPMIREVIREELGNIVQYGTEALKQLSSNMFVEQLQQNFNPVRQSEVVKSVVPAIQDNLIKESVEKAKDSIKTVKNRREKKKKIFKTVDQREHMIEIIKANGGEIKTSILIEAMKAKGYNFANPYSDLNRIMKITENVKREYGIFKLIEQKSVVK